jgi:transcriptional regulator with XRE-family HTH domain
MPEKTTRGHWPQGKRRNPDSGSWSRTRLVLTKFLGDKYKAGSVSIRALADALGVSDRSVRRWLAGEDRPEPDMQDAIVAWLAEKRGK